MKIPETSLEKAIYYFKAAIVLKINNFKYSFRHRKEALLKSWNAKHKPIVKWVPSYQTLEDQLQARCSHLKGGYRRSRLTIRDYAITDHTFIDGSRKIWCQLCKKTWLPGTIGWKRDVPEMLANTTNSGSSSEIPYGAVKDGTVRGYPDPKHSSRQYTTSYYNEMKPTAEQATIEKSKSTIQAAVCFNGVTSVPVTSTQKAVRKFYLEMKRALGWV